MNKLKILFLIGCFLQCKGREPFKPTHGSVNFLVYFPSRYRGLCVGTLVSRVAVITAAVCVTNPRADVTDTRAINVVVGATYRHPRRGIRVQVTKLVIPNKGFVTQNGEGKHREEIGMPYNQKFQDVHLPTGTGAAWWIIAHSFSKRGGLCPSISKFDSGNRGYLMSKSAAIMLLKRKVPDVLTEVPLRPIEIDWKGNEKVALQEECLITGWHFFYKGDRIYPVDKFLLQRNLRVQFVDVVKKNLWCEALTIKFQKALLNLGFHGMIEKEDSICIRDGMYGAPLVCRGIAVGLMMAPDGQWSNCTGYSNMIHLFASDFLSDFMSCVSSLFEAEEKKPWKTMKKSMYEDIQAETYDYVPEFYDKLTSSSASTDDEP